MLNQQMNEQRSVVKNSNASAADVRTTSSVPGSGRSPGERNGEEKVTTEDEMVGWHHQLDGHGFGWTSGVDDGQGGLACCDSWGHKESDTTE